MAPSKKKYTTNEDGDPNLTKPATLVEAFFASENQRGPGRGGSVSVSPGKFGLQLDANLGLNMGLFKKIMKC
jgi:hypothetical protein